MLAPSRPGDRQYCAHKDQVDRQEDPPAGPDPEVPATQRLECRLQELLAEAERDEGHDHGDQGGPAALR